MICIASVNKDLFNYVHPGNVPTNFKNFLKKIIKDYDDYNHITLADNKIGQFEKNIEDILKDTDDITTQNLCTEFLKILEYQEVKPLIKSKSKDPHSSDYVDFELSYKKVKFSNSVDILDPLFEDKVLDYKKKYKITLLTSNELSHKENCLKMLEKIFIASKNISFFRVGMGNQLLPFKYDKFEEITSNSDENIRNNLKDAMSSLLFISNLIIKIKKEGVFLVEDDEINLTIYTYQNSIKFQPYAENKFEFDEVSASKVLKKNIIQNKSLINLLVKYKIKVNFMIFILDKKFNSTDKKEFLKDCKDKIHYRWLYSSNGIFKFDHDKLADYDVYSKDKNQVLKKLHSFTVSRVGSTNTDIVDTLIINNSEELKTVKLTLPTSEMIEAARVDGATNY